MYSHENHYVEDCRSVMCLCSEKHSANWDSHEDCHCKAFMHAEGNVLNKLKV